MRKDFFHRDTNIGDYVVLSEPHYKNLVSGIVVKFTPKGIKAKYYSDMYGEDREAFVCECQFVKYPEEIPL